MADTPEERQTPEKLNMPITSMIGIMSIIGYFLLAYIAFTYYPAEFNPFNHYVSSLGDPTQNPQGAMFYNLAIKTVGLLGFFFYIGLYRIYSNEENHLFMKIALVSGLANSLTITLSGMYSVNVLAPYLTWSLLIHITVLPVLVSIGFALKDRSDLDKIISNIGFALAILDLIFIEYAVYIGMEKSALMEWITLLAYLSWVGLISYHIFIDPHDNHLVNQ